MNTKYAITMADGTLRIMTLVTDTTVEHEITKWTDADDVVSYREISDIDLPANRIFRDAWLDTGTTLGVDQNKAKTILRDFRNIKLEVLDQKAITEGRKPDGNLAAVDTLAQRLRDIPNDPKFSSGNLEDLEALMLEIDEVK